MCVSFAVVGCVCACVRELCCCGMCVRVRALLLWDVCVCVHELCCCGCVCVRVCACAHALLFSVGHLCITKPQHGLQNTVDMKV